MATDKTRLTELATAVGLVYEPSRNDPLRLDHLTVPGLDPDVWQPAVLPATTVGSFHRELLLRALDNGRAFRRAVLRGRAPDHVEWVGGAHAVWTSDIPRDLTVDGVWFIQAKYDSTCVLNTSPGSLVDDLLVDHTLESRHSWFAEVALDQLQAFYERARDDLPLAVLTSASPSEFPGDVRDLDRSAKLILKTAMRGTPPSAAQDVAYGELCRAVSLETTLRWRHHLDGSSIPQRTQMLFRMLRIAGGPYWLLGTKGHEPQRLRVMDTRTWRERFELKRFDVLDAHAGQPQVNWRAEIRERPSGDRHVVDGYCEIRWSHGKLQGNPECKVQVSTPLASIPGYEAMG
jgi:hypothetical protein